MICIRSTYDDDYYLPVIIKSIPPPPIHPVVMSIDDLFQKVSTKTSAIHHQNEIISLCRLEQQIEYRGLLAAWLKYPKMCVHRFGNYVMQLFARLDPVCVCSALLPRIVRLSKSERGCRIVQRLLESMRQCDLKAQMMLAISSELSDIAKSKYGNYVIQTYMNYINDETIVSIININIKEWIGTRYGSRVIDNACKMCPDGMFNMLSSYTDEAYLKMASNRYAKYSLHYILAILSREHRNELTSQINIRKKFTYHVNDEVS